MLRKCFLVYLVCIVKLATAQSVEEAKKFLYYDRFSSAELALKQVIQKEPQNTAAYYWLFQTMLQKGDTAAARQALADVEKLKQSNTKLDVDPLVEAGRIQLLLLDGKKDEAMAASEQLVKETKGKNADVLRALAKAQVDVKQGAGNYDYALTLVEQAIKRDKKNPENYIIMGDAWRRKGDGGNAVSGYMQALTIDPGYARANYSIGRVYLTQQNANIYLQHFLKAIEQDPNFSPAYYELYYHFYYRDVNEAKKYLEKYIATADKTVENDYMLTDLAYVSSKKQAAIDMAQKLLQQEGEKAKPRLYKLIAYSYDDLGDSLKALDYITAYFEKEQPEKYISKDYALKADLLVKVKDSAGRQEAIELWQKAVEADTLVSAKVDYMHSIAAAYKKMGDRSQEAGWLGKIVDLKEEPSNLDIYYWGLAHYAAGEYQMADSAFGIYAEKYPDQVHGYLWRAKSNAVIDSTMEQGLAVPYYNKVIEIADDDAKTNKSLLIQAYGYIGAYEANVEKDYPEALEHFKKILELDPANADASRYSEILQKWIEAGATKPDNESKSDTGN